MKLMYIVIILFLIVAGNGVAYIPEHAYLNASGMYNGVQETVLLKKYSKPEREYIKPRYEFVGEYYVGIESVYRSTNPEFRKVPIKEMFWHLKVDLNLTCWLHYKNGQWIVISYVFWPPGTLF
ncbi:hypothetical protein J2T26_003903 [Citrobacter farmeri]|uniref:hypothetical protein n=1 Tax=Citrobacter farmeri TaxID=67824 RepID=UPI0020A002A8|nr:hypothetical protein [Citrobacter farmeri]MCP1694016.1 hypothetical protein [Citrobacter farmeri]MCW2423935.1 hypothetical protein [Citrobacter farmeri]